MIIQGTDLIQDKSFEYLFAVILILVTWLLIKALNMLGLKSEAQTYWTHHSKTPMDFDTPDKTRHDIIEISSDESEYEDCDDGQPEPSNRAALLSPASKRTVVVDSDEYDTYTEADMNHDLFEPARLKRQKTDHMDDVNDAYIDGRFNAADFVDFTGIDEWDNGLDFINFDFTGPDTLANKEGRSDDHTTLAFRPPPTNDVVQIAKPNPKGKERDYQILLEEIEADTGPPELQAQPYYDDPIMEVRMYCGPGYDLFPIVLGSIAEHQDICDEWDRKQAKGGSHDTVNQVQQNIIEAYTNDTEYTIDGGVRRLSEPIPDVGELECLLKIREVFPDIQRRFVLDKIRQKAQALRCDTDNEIQILPDATSIVSEILELATYPQQKTCKITDDLAADGTGVTIQWKNGDIENKTYQRDAVQLLAMHFEYIPTHFLYKTVQQKKTLFESYICVTEIDHNYGQLAPSDRPYRRSQSARTELEKKYQQNQLGLRSKEQWEGLVNELQAAKQQLERKRLRITRENEQKALEEANVQSHRACGDLVECQCCFDDEIPLNRTVTCEDHNMHWFCYGCVLRLAENQIGLMKHEMACMDQSGCKATLTREGIRRSIPSKLFEKLDFFQQQFEISAACIEGLEQCPFCDFRAICDPVEVSMAFHCQNPDCKRITCRKCHENSHIPKSCEEAKKDKQISARHQIEEARSEAMMRTCPKCKVKIVKEIGCNKMKCGKCGCLMCYVCQVDISSNKDGGYSHFNATGAKCILYDKNFDRHEAEADEAEKTAIEKVRAENGDIDEKQLQIETGKLKRKPPAPSPRMRNMPGMLHPLRAPLPGHQPEHVLPPFHPAVRREGIQGDANRPVRREAHRHHFEDMLQRVMQQERQAEAQARKDMEEIEKNLGLAAGTGPPSPRRHSFMNRLANARYQAPQLPINPPLHLPFIAPRGQNQNTAARDVGPLNLQPPALGRDIFQHMYRDPLGPNGMPGLLWNEPNLWANRMGARRDGNNFGQNHLGNVGPHRPFGQHDANVEGVVPEWLRPPILGVDRTETRTGDNRGQRPLMYTQLGNLHEVGRNGV